MKLGLSLPHLGRDATPEKLVDFSESGVNCIEVVVNAQPTAEGPI